MKAKSIEIFLVISILYGIQLYSQKNINGEYQSNFAPYGICTENLRIQNDSSCQYFRKFDIFQIEYYEKRINDLYCIYDFQIFIWTTIH